MPQATPKRKPANEMTHAEWNAERQALAKRSQQIHAAIAKKVKLSEVTPDILELIDQVLAIQGNVNIVA
jgi:hypothetical protein